MFKVVVIGPDKDNGKGGVSSVINNSFNLLKDDKLFDLNFIESYGSKRFSAIRALVSIFHQCIFNKNEIYWFHLSQHFSIIRKLLLSICCILFKKKIIYQLHSPRIENYLGNFWGRQLIKMMLTTSDKVVVLSDYWKFMLLKEFPHYPHKILVLSNPLVLPHYFEPIKPENKTDFFLLTMARLIKDKGVDKIVNAMKYNKFKLIVAGDGEELENLKSLAKQSGVYDRIEFTGWVNDDEKEKLFAKASIFVLPSKYDSFGMSFAESMARGVPVVAFKLRAIEHLVLDGITGKLIECDDEISINNAIDLIRADINNFSIECAYHIERNFSSVIFCRQFSLIIKDIKNYDK